MIKKFLCIFIIIILSIPSMTVMAKKTETEAEQNQSFALTIVLKEGLLNVIRPNTEIKVMTEEETTTVEETTTEPETTTEAETTIEEETTTEPETTPPDPTRILRDELEQQQIISFDPERQRELSSLSTDLNTEQEDIKTIGLRVLYYLANEESEATLTEALSDDWFPTMLTEDLVIGERNYHYDGPNLSGVITVVSDEMGEKYTFIKAVSLKNGLIYLEIGPDAIRFIERNDPENEHHYIVQTLYTDDGTFISNEGYVSDEGLAVDGLNVFLSDKLLEAGILEAWETRFDDGLTYNGDFTRDGKTIVVTPEELIDLGQLCYATLETEGETLYLAVEGDDDRTFTAEDFGLYTVWDE